LVLRNPSDGAKWAPPVAAWLERLANDNRDARLSYHTTGSRHPAVDASFLARLSAGSIDGVTINLSTALGKSAVMVVSRHVGPIADAVQVELTLVPVRGETEPLVQRVRGLAKSLAIAADFAQGSYVETRDGISASQNGADEWGLSVEDFYGADIGADILMNAFVGPVGVAVWLGETLRSRVKAAPPAGAQASGPDGRWIERANATASDFERWLAPVRPTGAVWQQFRQGR
jgi:hypothetical protein